ncbi:unnamed protein product [Moneuplotes crassus]|uniref:Uncharacterized protein n=1 Tax=Euplotes crassus TaxID=5936 RepID=A0AAD1XL80_EUPCR|nr:unnamed protein product [Moneuplotes crassus]
MEAHIFDKEIKLYHKCKNDNALSQQLQSKNAKIRPKLQIINFDEYSICGRFKSVEQVSSLNHAAHECGILTIKGRYHGDVPVKLHFKYIIRLIPCTMEVLYLDSLQFTSKQFRKVLAVCRNVPKVSLCSVVFCGTVLGLRKD